MEIRLKNIKVCNSLLSKIRGLMFSKKRNLIFIFKKEKMIEIHMLFVFFPIWVVYLNKEKKVTYIKKLQPFISSSNQKGQYVLEFTEKPDVKLGDKISW
jgi:hypothetical protein